MSNSDLPLEGNENKNSPGQTGNPRPMGGPPPRTPQANLSPVRPETPAGRQPILPSIPRPTRPEAPVRADPTPTEEIDLSRSSQERAISALDRLRQKMAAVAEEYAQGKLNRAQFNAIYRRYQEQRDITERLLQRDPKTGAWQTVVQPGVTGFLRDHFEAKVESYSVYDLKTGRQIIRTGSLQLPQAQVVPILNKLYSMIVSQRDPGIARRAIQDDRFVVFVPGAYTVSVVVFSLEPAVAQLEMVQDMHNDFERANIQIFTGQRLNPHEMVFPHRALFE